MCCTDQQSPTLSGVKISNHLQGTSQSGPNSKISCISVITMDSSTQLRLGNCITFGKHPLRPRILRHHLDQSNPLAYTIPM